MDESNPQRWLSASSLKSAEEELSLNPKPLWQVRIMTSRAIHSVEWRLHGKLAHRCKRQCGVDRSPLIVPDEVGMVAME